MPALAVKLSERQFQIFQAAWPVSGRTAIASLQPLVNLARLTGRAGDPEGAYRAFDGINRAAHHGGSAAVHGAFVSFNGFTAVDGDRSKASLWLRTSLREDGTRVLAAEFMHLDLVEEAEQSGDAFAAREVLGHPGCHARMTPEQTRALTTLVQQAGLSAGSIPEPLLDDLMVSTQIAETVLAQTLRVGEV